MLHHHKTIVQLFAVIKTEIRFCLRRKWSVVTMAVICIVVAAGILILTIKNLEYLREYSDMYNTALHDPSIVERLKAEGIIFAEMLTPDEIAIQSTGISLLTFWGPFLFLSLLLLPVASISTIPVDQQSGALELVQTTSVGGSIYLLGKVLGVFVSVLITALVVFIFFISAMVLLVGYAPLGVLIKLAVFDGIPIIAWASAISVLAGAVIPRSISILGGFIIGVVSYFIWMLVAKSPYGLWSLLDLISYNLFHHYGIITDRQSVTAGTYVFTCFCLASIMFVFAFIIRIWLKRRENF